MFVPVKWTARQTYLAVKSVPEVAALYNANYAIATEARATLVECEATALVITTIQLNQMERDLAIAAGVPAEAKAEAKKLLTDILPDISLFVS